MANEMGRFVFSGSLALRKFGKRGYMNIYIYSTLVTCI